jgi:hypothetical protein
MKRELAEVLLQVCPGDLQEEYSGKGMYGKTTTGIVVESVPEFLTAILQNVESLAEAFKEEGIDRIDAIHWDSLGTSTIIY